MVGIFLVFVNMFASVSVMFLLTLVMVLSVSRIILINHECGLNIKKLAEVKETYA